MSTSETHRATPTPKTRRLHRLLLLVALAATVAIPFLLGGANTLSAAAHIPAAGYAGLLALIVTSWVARALKLHQLLHRLQTPASFRRAFGISLATDLAFAATPAGVGGYVASIYYLRQAGTSGSGAATITAMDQGIDLVFFALAVPLAALALAGSGLSQAMTLTALGGAALTSGFLIALWFGRRRVVSLLATPNAWSARWPRVAKAQHSLRGFVASMAAHVASIVEAGPRFLIRMLALTALQWLSRYAVLWLTLLLLGHAVSFALAFLLQVVVLHAALWTGIPAGGGGAELGLTATLAPWIAPGEMATALIVWRAATLYTSLLAGSVAIVLLARRSRRNIAPG
ncbi:MAG: lysylphosphatidylglycerol synthase transmembrane domain-containing protein [Rhodanobacteraceae bacterium]